MLAKRGELKRDLPKSPHSSSYSSANAGTADRHRGKSTKFGMLLHRGDESQLHQNARDSCINPLDMTEKHFNRSFSSYGIILNGSLKLNTES